MIERWDAPPLQRCLTHSILCAVGTCSLAAMESKSYRTLLSLDGGGIRGLMQGERFASVSPRASPGISVCFTCCSTTLAVTTHHCSTNSTQLVFLRSWRPSFRKSIPKEGWVVILSI